MAVKNWMHPRNIYRNPPNFKELAIAYPEFRKYVKQELTGRVSIDYQDPKAVSELTRTLLMKDFSLNVEIMETRLIPRVPLCLNYILWIEDLLGSLNIGDNQPYGIDIGTGACCIYPLLAAKKGWKMLATEVDKINAEMAVKNVKNNSLENEITVTVVKNSEEILDGVIDNITYDFCMCNPPFFDHGEKPLNRTDRRIQLQTVASSNPTEVVTGGGEVNFVKRIISESKLLKEKIKIYTSLIGKKSDFLLLQDEVKQLLPDKFAVTEFCQGRTTRWGIAWTYLDINLENKSEESLQKVKKAKVKNAAKHVITKGQNGIDNVNNAMERIKVLLSNLQLNYATEHFDDESSCLKVKAYENTWSHQRRKKREKRRTETDAAESTNSLNDSSASDEPPAKKLKEDSSETKPRTVLVEFLMLVREDDSNIILELPWLSGGKEFIHQILQYIKNNWDKSEQT